MVGYGRTDFAGHVAANMNKQAQLPLWLKIGVALLWVGFATNVTYDYIVYHRVTPFSILFFLALLAGFVLPKIFNWPVYTKQPSRPAIISLIILFIILIAYFMITVFLS